MRTAPSAHRIGSYVAVLAIVSVMLVGSLPGLASAPARSAAPLSTHSAAGSITSGHTTMAPRPSTLSEVWARLSVGAPSPRSYYGAAWDPQLGGLLIFGGCEGGVPWGDSSYCSVMTNETWVFVGNQWENLTGPVAPSPRLTPMMAYDPSTGGVLLFGGGTGPASSDCATDTWLYTASGWQELYPSTVPGCAETGMDFDGNLGHVLLVASASGTDLSAQENVSWEFAGGSWTVLPATSSFNRVSPMMIYDSTDQETVLFGGFDLNCGCQNLQDTWVFRQGAWTEIYPAQSPGARNSAAFTDDPSRGGALMWGGHYAYQFYNDTWLFHNGSWDPLPTPVAPEYAWAMQMVLDPSTSSVILYGGYNFTNSIGQFSNETWLYAYPSPFTGVNLSIAPSRITVGEEAVLFAGASGGLGDLTYTYYGLPAGCSTANTSVLLCVPTSTGSYPGTGQCHRPGGPLHHGRRDVIGHPGRGDRPSLDLRVRGVALARDPRRFPPPGGRLVRRFRGERLQLLGSADRLPFGQRGVVHLHPDTDRHLLGRGDGQRLRGHDRAGERQRHGPGSRTPASPTPRPDAGRADRPPRSGHGRRSGGVRGRERGRRGPALLLLHRSPGGVLQPEHLGAPLHADGGRLL